MGNQFALTELQLVLMQLVRRFRLELVADTALPTMNPLVTLRPGEALLLRLVPRTA